MMTLFEEYRHELAIKFVSLVYFFSLIQSVGPSAKYRIAKMIAYKNKERKKNNRNWLRPSGLGELSIFLFIWNVLFQHWFLLNFLWIIIIENHYYYLQYLCWFSLYFFFCHSQYFSLQNSNQSIHKWMLCLVNWILMFAEKQYNVDKWFEI